jgi:hypothetical protein
MAATTLLYGLGSAEMVFFWLADAGPGSNTQPSTSAAERDRERAVSDCIQDRFCFTLVRVEDRAERLNLEGKMISTVSLCDASCLSATESVRTLLRRRGVDPDLLAVRSAGTLEPREEGNTEVARSVNRRVSFSVGIDE